MSFPVKLHLETTCQLVVTLLVSHLICSHYKLLCWLIPSSQTAQAYFTQFFVGKLYWLNMGWGLIPQGSSIWTDFTNTESFCILSHSLISVSRLAGTKNQRIMVPIYWLKELNLLGYSSVWFRTFSTLEKIPDPFDQRHEFIPSIWCFFSFFFSSMLNTRVYQSGDHSP